LNENWNAKMAETTAKVDGCDTLPRLSSPRHRSIETAHVSPADSDLLYKLEAIAAFCGMTPGQAQPLVGTGIIPTFKLPNGSSILCASKSAINEAWQQHEREWRTQNPINIKEKLRQRKQKRERKLSQSDKSANLHPNGQPLANAPAEEKSCNVTGVTKPDGMSAS
jgi:hypothetical protein